MVQLPARSWHYRKMDVTREHISRILKLTEILLSIQTGFSLVNAAVVCAILESISGLEFAKSQRAVENWEKWRKVAVKSSVVPQRPSRLRDR